MGLDMYLERCDRKVWGYKNFDLDVIKGEKPDLYNELKPYIIQRGKNFHWESLFEEVGYWRKANHIHSWFVDNVQDGVDDCDYHNEVTETTLHRLLNACMFVLESCKLVEGKINDGYEYVDGERVPILVDGKYVENTSVAEELLPTTSGFFFGGTNYDEWYVRDIKKTIQIIRNVLDTTDFETHMVYYVSSW